MPANPTNGQLVQQIADEIAQNGAIPFARFMDLCLYCPVHGFYERKKDTVGRDGDFYTSVSVGPLFGEILAFQFAEWLTLITPQPETLHLVEAGAHDGRLAHDILSWFNKHRPTIPKRLQYIILEPSAQRQNWQREKLSAFSSQVRWLDCSPTALRSHFTGIVFCNELLDAMPVRRLGWDANAKTWFEWGVTVRDERFEWAQLGNIPVPKFIPSATSFLETLPNGFTIEMSPAAEQWWRNAANMLSAGKLMTIDYGLRTEELFMPHRISGTLRTYSRHQVSDDPLANPGEQDITAHINFTTLQQAGEQLGLRTEIFEPQTTFLTRILHKAWENGSGFGDWTPAYTRQFQSLTHPEHLGHSFRVLVQTR